MISNPQQGRNSSQNEPLADVLDRYLTAREQGERPDAEELIAAHPAIAGGAARVPSASSTLEIGVG